MNNCKKLEDLILRVKMYSEKECFREIYRHHRPILDDVYKAFSLVYDFVRNNQIDIYQQYYIIVWQAIKEYDFECEEGFSYFFKIFVIDKIKKHIQKEYRVNSRHMVSNETLDKLMSNIKGYYQKWLDKEMHLRALSNLTEKQLQAVYLTSYRKKTCQEAADLLGISIDTFKDRLRYSYEKMRNSVYGSRSKKVREIVYETVVVSENN